MAHCLILLYARTATVVSESYTKLSGRSQKIVSTVCGSLSQSHYNTSAVYSNRYVPTAPKKNDSATATVTPNVYFEKGDS